MVSFPSPALASSDSIQITANGNQISWQTTGTVGQATGLFTTYVHTDPAVSTGLSWVYSTDVDDGGATFWPDDGAGVYEVQVCEWDFVLEQTTVCSNVVEVTWIHDVNGHFVPIPAADPADETGTLTLTADGTQLHWEVAGTLGQGSGFMLMDGMGEYWQAPQAREAEWYPADELPMGIHELQLCSYDHYRDQLGPCSNPVTIEVAVNGWGTTAAVPQPDPADETGSIELSLDGCQLQWGVTGTLGSATGFMVLTELGATPEFGLSTHRYAYPADRTRALDDLWIEGAYQVMVCSYDFHRHQIGHCSLPQTFDLSLGAGIECTTEPGAWMDDIPPTYDPAVTAGLAAWRTPDANGNSCASCHAPDGIDLAYPDYSRADILRRASAHVDAATGNAIADMIEAVRDHYGWVPTADPREYRPFQPGGQPLPGETALERDEAFANQLFDMGLLIATGDIDDLTSAMLARDELLALDLWNLPLGIPFDRYSEDAFFGPEHGRLNEWVPAVGHVATPDDPTTWEALQDLYLADPNDDSLYAMLQALTGADRPVMLNHDDYRGGIEEFEAERYRSLLVLAHEQRREMAGGSPRGADDVRPYQTGAIWHTGTQAYQTWTCNPLHHGYAEDCMQLPTGTLDPQHSFFEQMDQMALAWRTAGWLFNQHLEDVPGEQTFLSGHYLGIDLKMRGYPSHHAFMRATRAVRKFWGPDDSWRAALAMTEGPNPPTAAFADLLFMDHFMSQGGQGEHDVTYAPAGGLHRERYLRFTANMYKMLLRLLEHEITTNGQVYDKTRLVELLEGEADHRWYGPVDFMPALIAHRPEQEAQMTAWLSSMATMVQAAQERDPTPGID